MATGATRVPARVAVLADSALDGDSRAHRVASAAAAAGYQVTLIGSAVPNRTPARAPARADRPAGVTAIEVPLEETLRSNRSRRPRPGLRWPFAYRSAAAHDHRTTLVTAYAALLATRAAELDIVHRPLPLRAAARAGLAAARLRQAVRRVWTALRAAQYQSAVRRRMNPDALIDNLATAATRLLLGKRCWRRLDPGLLDLEVAYGPVLDELRPHLIHALGHAALGVAIRAALRAEGAGHRIEVVWDAIPAVPVRGRRAAVARDAHERAFGPEADGVVTFGEGLAEGLRKRYGLMATPAVVRNAPPLPEGPGGVHPHGIRDRCRLGPEVPLLVHSGAVAPERGLPTVIEALPKLYDLHAAFVVPDPDDPQVGVLVERAAELGVAQRLHILPYVPVGEIPAFLASADIGVLPVHQLPQHQMALATRYFEYAHARLPVVVSDVRAMAAATLELGNGEVFRAQDTADFVRAVGAVLTNPRRYRKAYDRSDVLRQWSWQTQSAPLLDLYTRLLGPRHP